LRQLAWIAGAVAIAGFLVRFPAGHHTGDSFRLMQGTRVIGRCLQSGTWHGCGLSAPGIGNGSSVGPFALLQYLSVALPAWLGVSDRIGVALLSGLNALCLVGVGGLGWWLLRDRPTARRLWPVLVVASPLLYYGASSFGEAQLVFLLCLMVVAAVGGRGWLPLAVTVFAVSLTKETMAPYAWAVAALAVLVAHPVAQRRRRLLGAGAGAVAAVVVNAGFNWFRYESFTNVEYNSFSQLPGYDSTLRPVKNFVAILFAPVNGLITTWPAVLLLLLLLVVGVVRRGGLGGPGDGLGGPGDGEARTTPRLQSFWNSGRFVPLALLAVLFGYWVPLSWWYAPLGWVAWGPRLALPLVLPAALVALFALPEARWRSWAIAAQRHRGAGVLVGGVLVLSAWMSAGGLVNQRQVLHRFVLGEGPTDCFPFAKVGLRLVQCAPDFAWRRGWELDRLTLGPAGWIGTTTMVAIVVWVAVWLTLLWRAAREPLAGSVALAAAAAAESDSATS
jgi:hypothetical protein